ncbi:uncharacterized protein LOC143275061 [Babylonia areolata]|uniref:uncharacterized protein LOC143275061 n=1 Tax=Babylonia areolata TaxID=304850 RepID=UPI003FD45007
MSVSSHQCKYNEVHVNKTEASCADFLSMFVKGWDLDRDSMAEGDIDMNTVCPYLKKIHKEVIGCCEGWTGDACDTPDCEGCDQGECVELEGPGVPASTPPYCRCFENYGGKRCDEDLREVNTADQYCFEDSSCEGAKTSPHVMARSACCSGGTGSWGSSVRSECTPCASTQGEVNDTVSVERDRVTCLTAGEDIYRTFDGASFLHHSTCSVGLLRAGTGLELYTSTSCLTAGDICNCRKDVKMNFMKNDEHYSLRLQENTVTVTGPDGTDVIPVTNEKSSIGNNIVFKREDESVFFWVLIEELSFRRDDSGLFMLTLKKTSPLVGNIQGVCGNFDGKPENDRASLDALFQGNMDEEEPVCDGLVL